MFFSQRVHRLSGPGPSPHVPAFAQDVRLLGWVISHARYAWISLAVGMADCCCQWLLRCQLSLTSLGKPLEIWRFRHSVCHVDDGEVKKNAGLTALLGGACHLDPEIAALLGCPESTVRATGGLECCVFDLDSTKYREGDAILPGLLRVGQACGWRIDGARGKVVRPNCTKWQFC